MSGATLVRLGLVLLLSPSIAASQTADDVRAAFQASPSERAQAKFAAAAAGAPSAVGPSAPQVTVEAGIANSKAQIVLDVRKGLEVSLSVPEDKKEDSTKFTDLDDLSDKVTLGFNFSRGFGKLVSPDIPEALEKACEALGWDVKKVECTDSTKFEQKVQKELQGKARRDALKSLSFLDKGFLQGFSIKGAVAYKKFDYFDATAEKQKDTELSRSLTAAYVATKGGFRVAFGLTLQQDFKDSSVVGQKCVELEDAEGLESCQSLPVGAPKDDDELIVRLELRQLWTNWAVSPTLAFNLENDVTGIDVPIYFLRDDKKRFTGGARVGWRSDDDELVASVFVTKPLSFH